MAIGRPTPDEHGMIPCTCCRNGTVRDTLTGARKPCTHCNGTLRRKAPDHYTYGEDYAAEQVRQEEAARRASPAYRIRECETFEELREVLAELHEK